MIDCVSRSERLLELLQTLRRHRHPVSGQALASQAGVSIRTLYRDITSLQRQGAAIVGSPGVGYVLRPGFMLPPLMFQGEEIEALVLGMRWVADRGDHGLSHAARNAMAKIAAMLPPELRKELDDSALLVGTNLRKQPCAIGSDLLRGAIRAEHKLRLAYRDASAAESQRVVWPFALVYFEQSHVLCAWCETRNDFRNFRADYILEAEDLAVRYPQRRQTLIRKWRAAIEASGRSILPESDSIPT